MKVCSVNMAAGPGQHINNPVNKIDNRIAIDKIVINLNKMCFRLDTPDSEFYNVFSQLKSSSITKTPQEKIAVEPGGVVGDKHFNPPALLAFNQISILTIERYTELNKLHNKNIQAGEFGENITVKNMNLESISYGTILQFGDTAQVRICHLRTFCYKFAMVLLTADEYFYYYKSTVSQLISVKRIGVIGNVIKSGIIMPNDIVRVVYEPPEHIALQCAF